MFKSFKTTYNEKVKKNKKIKNVFLKKIKLKIKFKNHSYN